MTRLELIAILKSLRVMLADESSANAKQNAIEVLDFVLEEAVQESHYKKNKPDKND